MVGPVVIISVVLGHLNLIVAYSCKGRVAVTVLSLDVEYWSDCSTIGSSVGTAKISQQDTEMTRIIWFFIRLQARPAPAKRKILPTLTESGKFRH